MIADSSGTLTVDNCTIAGNTIGGTIVASGGSLTNSLIYQPGVSSSFDTATYVLANDISLLPPGATVNTIADPKFVDPGNGDYHLQLSSPAIDYAGGLGGTDLDGYPRDVNLAAAPDAFGPRDLGAYERQTAFACDDQPDALFCATFEP